MDFVCGCFFGNKICSLSNLATTPTLFHSDRPMRFIVALVLSSMWFGFLGSNEWWNTKGEIYRTGECNPTFWMFLWPWPWLETYAFAGSAWFSLQVLVQFALSLCFVWYLSYSMGVVRLWSPVFFRIPVRNWWIFGNCVVNPRFGGNKSLAGFGYTIIYEHVFMKRRADSMYLIEAIALVVFCLIFFITKNCQCIGDLVLLGGWAASW